MSLLENTTGYTRGAMTQYAPGHSEAQCNQWSPWDAVQHYSSAVRHYLHYSLVTPVQIQCISFRAALDLATPSATLLETSWHSTFIASIQCLLATFNFSQSSSSSSLKPPCAAPVSHFISSFRKILGPSKTLAKSAFLQINQLFSSDCRRPVVAF